MSEDQALIKAQENMIAEISPFEAQSRELLVKAQTQEVTNEQQLASAVAVKKQITTYRKLVTDTRLSITRRFDDVKKAIMNRESEILLPLDEAQTTLGEKMLTYTEEQDRIKAEEADRVNKMVERFSVPDVYRFKTLDEVQDEGERFKKMYTELKQEDQVNAAVKAAFTVAINRLSDRRDYLQEQAAQEAERQRLAAEAQKQSADRQKIEQEKAANEAKARKIETEKERLEREKQRKADEEAAVEAQAKADAEERNRVKTGARTVTSFEVVSPELVPREYCTPNDSLIRAAIKQGISVPGVNVSTEKKI